MLVEIRIRDYATIDDLSLELRPGLNALTGETGAGKSIVVGALSLLLGERASSDVVRAGAERAVIEAAFDVSHEPDVLARMAEAGVVPDDGLLILKREVQAEGRNRAWANGSPATASLVGELGSALVDLHGQHEHQTLLRRPEQRTILDAFAGLEEEAARVRILHGERKDLERRLREKEERQRELESQADFLRFQVGEIEEAAVEPDEEDPLEEEARRLENAEELARDAGALYEALYGDEEAVADRLAVLRDLARRLARIDGDLEDAAEALDGAYHAAAEVGRTMADYASGVEHDPARLDEIRQRQELLFRLKRKYGPELEDVVETGRRVRAELEELEAAGMDMEALEEELARVTADLGEAAEALSAGRAEAAGRLAGEVEALLPELGMGGGVFRVVLEPRDEIGAGGAEAVEFRASLNPGFEPRPLAKIASGGELSRVMLALKSILARVDRVPTLVFDEIDAGIGGGVAGRVAVKLREVAEHHQVFVITHLPQLASRAHAHFHVEKAQREGLAATRVRELGGEERVGEIARMLGGDPESDTSREHARELLRV